MKDPSEAVTLWGLTAAKHEIVALLHDPQAVQQDLLMSATLSAVKAHGSELIIEEAYAALTLDTTDNLKGISPEMLKAVVPTLLDLFDYRIALYATKAPDDPLVEMIPILFLTKARVWSAETRDQQRRVLALMIDLMRKSMQLFARADPTGKEDLVNQVRLSGRAFLVVGQVIDQEPMRNAARMIGEITSASSDVPARIANLEAAVQQAGLATIRK